METMSCNISSCEKENCPDKMEEGDVLVDIHEARARIANYLQHHDVYLNTMVNIVLYNTDTLFTFLMGNPSYESYECMNCADRYESETGKDCEGKACAICPFYSFVPSGFEKFSGCERIEGRIGLSKYRDRHNDISEMVKKSLSVRESLEGTDIFSFELPSDVLNEFEGKAELENFIFGLYPEHKLTEAWTEIQGARLIVKIRCEAQAVESVA